MLATCSIFAAAQPESVSGLFKYLYNVRWGAERLSAGSLGWKAYDIQFRLKRVNNHSISWGTIDQELWFLYVSS
jgi:hypothetical protein